MDMCNSTFSGRTGKLLIYLIFGESIQPKPTKPEYWEQLLNKSMCAYILKKDMGHLFLQMRIVKIEVKIEIDSLAVLAFDLLIFRSVAQNSTRTLTTTQLSSIAYLCDLAI